MSAATTAEEFEERQATQRRVGAFDSLAEAVEESTAILEVPPSVESIVARDSRGLVPKLSAEAFELARQVYFLQHGTLADAARAIIASGLSDTDDLTTVRERLQTWWAREKWPKRPTMTTFAIRDANHDGGLYRGRLCIDVTTGAGPAPKGKRCAQSALPDSEHCFHHDPRPEYAEARRRSAERLTEGRRAGLVPLGPFQAWCEQQHKRLLAEERARRKVHPNNTGWGLLADAMGVDQSALHRLIQGTHGRDRPPVTSIKAATVARYVAPLGASFEDIYGCDPPVVAGNERLICPECGGPKNHESKACRACHEVSLGEPCPYVNGRGERCGIPTKHESGYCSRCRRIVFRVHRPKTGRPSFVTTPMLILALGKYRELPRLAWVARCMWAVDAGGVRDVFKQQRSLESALVKQFRKRGWATQQQAELGRAQLVAEHGEVPWPEADAPVPIEAAGMVPFVPFRAWLAACYAELGSYAKLSQRVRMNPDHLSRWIRGEAKDAVRRATVDRALEQWGDGTTFADLYGEGAS